MKKTAQSTIEYMVLIAVVAAALSVTAVYTKRALQGRIRSGADQISSEGVYNPGGTRASITVERSIVETGNTYVDKPAASRAQIADVEVGSGVIGAIYKKLGSIGIINVIPKARSANSGISVAAEKAAEEASISAAAKKAAEEAKDKDDTAAHSGGRKSVTDTWVAIEQKTTREEYVSP